jgi:glycosyltransferase involved in cell wall biosynthesis
VVDRATGLHVPPRDPAAIAGALAELLANPELRSELGRAGQRRASSRYSWDRVAAETEKAYRQALADRATSGRMQPAEGAAL